MNRVRAAVIGLGVGEQHIAGWNAHPGCEVVAVCDLDPAKLSRFEDLRTTTDAFELLEDPEIDAVSVASYDDAHFAQIRAALSNGKHVFAEKPLVLHADEAVEIAALLRANPAVRLSTNVPLRRSPRFMRLRAAIAGGELGELFHLEGDYEYGRRHKLTDGWRGRIPYYSVVLGGAIHMVDLLLWMSGLRVTEVVAAEGTRIATRDTAFRHPDFVTALLRTETGATMKVNANLGCVSPHFHAVRIYGTEGTFVNGLPDGVLHRAGGSEHVSDPYPGVHKGDLIHSFAEAILTGAPADVTEVDVFNTLSVCLAIDAARFSGRRATIENPLQSLPG
jgi:predicted dehydrogenase